jgi:hypothetical protein
MLMQYPPDMQQHMQAQQPPIDPNTGMAAQHDMRPISQHGYQDFNHYQAVNYAQPPAYPVGAHHMHHIRHHSEMYEGSPAPEDSKDETGGAKRKKSGNQSAQNEQELRALLAKYQHKTLEEIAAEVQRNEGGNGKSEKAKQVFAMIWYVDDLTRVFFCRSPIPGYETIVRDQRVPFVAIASLLGTLNGAATNTFRLSTPPVSVNWSASSSRTCSLEDSAFEVNRNITTSTCPLSTTTRISHTPHL